MKDEINIQIEGKRVFTNAIRCMKRIKNVTRKTSLGSSKRVKKISGSLAPVPSRILACSH